MPGITVRLAQTSDRETLVGFMAGMLTAARAIEANRASLDVAAAPHTDDLLRDVRNNDGAVFIAELGGSPVGFVACTMGEEPGVYVRQEERRFGQVNNLFVEEGVRGQGVAEALMTAAKDHLSARDVSHLRLSVLDQNARARNFYEKCGWVPYEVSYRMRL